jgi:hypothetical protein
MIKGLFVGSMGADMYTTILAYVIAFLGLVMIVGGLAGLLLLWSQSSRPVSADAFGRPNWSGAEDNSARIKIPRRYYAMAVAMICGGFGMAGIAQGLRVLVAIATRLQNMH